MYVQITTTSLRIKEVSKFRGEGNQTAEGGVARDGKGEVLYEFPLFRISYCGTDQSIDEAFSFVAKDTDGR